MLTPRFEIEQDADSLTVTIYAPFTNVIETEIFFDDLDFRFYSRPYFLRLHLPHPVEETDDATAHYDADSLSFVVTVPKKVNGQFFPGLEMLTSLLQPKGRSQLPDLVQQVGDEGCQEDWYVPQHIPPVEENESGILNEYGCGFASRHKGVFGKLLEECQQVFHVKNMHEKSFRDRRKEKTAMEEASFSSDHYLADLFEPPDELELCLRTEVPTSSDEFSTEEKQRMVSLGNKIRQVLTPKENMAVMFGMLDILYAHCYDLRTNGFDSDRSTESSWTIRTLAATLSCGERYSALDQVVTSTLRRTLCYPLYRHFRLGLKVWNDVLQLLLVPTSIVKVFLNLIPLFVDDSYGHLFNQLYLEEYAVWCQSSLQSEKLKELAEAIETVLRDEKAIQDRVGFHLTRLVDAARLNIEAAPPDALEDAMRSMSVMEKSSVQAQLLDSDDDEASSSSDDDTDDSESSSESYGEKRFENNFLDK